MKLPIRVGIQRKTGWGYAYVTFWIGNRGWMKHVRFLREREPSRLSLWLGHRRVG